MNQYDQRTSLFLMSRFRGCPRAFLALFFVGLCPSNSPRTVPSLALELALAKVLPLSFVSPPRFDPKARALLLGLHLDQNSEQQH